MTPDRHGAHAACEPWEWYHLARQVMGTPGTRCAALEGRTTHWSWPVEAVRTRVGRPDDLDWFLTVIELQGRGLAQPHFLQAPLRLQDDGTVSEHAGWRDEPLCDWADVTITSGGILALMWADGVPL